MNKAAFLLVLSTGSAFADPLDLNDYASFFDASPDEVEVLSETRSAISLGPIIVLRDTTQERDYIGIDESGQGAVGCFVSILATIESGLQACEVSLPVDQAAVQSTYLNEAIDFYVANAVPTPELDTVRQRFDALVASQIEGARPFCASFDVVTDLADRLFTPDSRSEVTAMMSIPRLPVANPCL